MALSDLPDDILNLISIRLNGFDNCFLWMASDSKLKERLVNNIITDFDIKYTIPGRYLWPGNFLKKLKRLSRLSLVVDKEVLHIPVQNVEIFPIPTLKYLKLNFKKCGRVFDQNRLLSSNDSRGPTTSSSRYINLKDYYSNLEHLEIISSWGDGYFFYEFFGCLPQNLQTLLILQNYLKHDPDNPNDDINHYLQLLPRTLTRFSSNFETPFNNNRRLDFSRFPPNLTSLQTNLPVCYQASQIPENLKFLDLSCRCDIANLLPLLPAGLENLSINLDDNASSNVTFGHLENLETLSLDSEDVVEFDDLITKCPPKLKSFVCNNLCIRNITVPSRLFGTCMTRLALSNTIAISAQFISSLPQSLTDLTIVQPSRYTSTQVTPPFAYFEHLPRNLKSLLTNLDILEKTSLLPQSLTSLRLTNSNPCDASHFDRLPPKLETLEVEEYLPSSIAKSLPASLTCLSFYLDQNVDEDFLRLLPRGLKQFSSFVGKDNITDAGVAHLPPSLTYLFLSSNTHITDHGIALLPRGLRHLDLPMNPNFTDECIKHLPRKLIALHLDAATKITSKSCKDLPRYLGALTLSSCKNWDPETLIASKNELPEFLTTVYVGNPPATTAWQKMLRK